MAVTVPSVEQRVRERVEAELAVALRARPDAALGLGDQEWVYQLVGRAVSEEHRRNALSLSRSECELIWRRVFGSVTPLGALAEHLADPEVEEVRINGTATCYVIRQGRRLAVPPPFADEAALISLVQWYTDGAGGSRLDRASPTVTMTLPDGSRLHAALSPPARPMSVTIRKHPPSRFSNLAQLAAAGFLPDPLRPFLEAAVRGRLNLLIAGGSSTGKTTLARALCHSMSEHERLVTIEDQAELHLWRDLPDCISLEGRPPNTEGLGTITIQMLVHEALRMSPDRIVIGEVRGAEALELLDAMNTGHPGSISTIHSDSPRETLPRLVRLALRNPRAPGAEAIMGEAARTVDLLLHLGSAVQSGERTRRLQSVGFVAGFEAGQPVVEELVRADPLGGWRTLASPAALPERTLAKLRTVAVPETLLGRLDA